MIMIRVTELYTAQDVLDQKCLLNLKILSINDDILRHEFLRDNIKLQCM